MSDDLLPAGYSRIDRAQDALVLLDACRASLLDFFSTPLATWRAHPEALSYLGKGRHFSVPLPGGAGRAFVRQWSHGGGVRWLGRWFPRAKRAIEELRALVVARAAGVDVPEPLAVRIERLPIGCRLVTVTREIDGARDLPSLLGAFDGMGDEDRTRLRRWAARALGQALGRLRRAGVFPADLHLRNVLLTLSPEPRLFIVDLDPLLAAPGVSRGQGRNGSDPAAVRCLARVYRSVLRWRLAGLRADPGDVARFWRAYSAAGAPPSPPCGSGISETPSDPCEAGILEAIRSRRTRVRDGRGVILTGQGPMRDAAPGRLSILFKMPNWLGDAVMAMPLLEGARRRWPDARISVLTEEKFKDLYALAPVPVDVFAYARGRATPALSAARERGCDGVVCVPRSFGAVRLTARLCAPVRVGFDGPLRRLFLTHRIRTRHVGAGRHRVETFWALGAPFAFGPFPPPPRLVVPPLAAREAAVLLAEVGIADGASLIGVNPGAAYGPAKQWPVDRFIESARALASRPGARLLVFGSPSEACVAGAVAREVGPAAVSLAGRTTLPQLAALIARCRAFVTNDTGPMHMAAALGVPVVAVFGSTDPVATGPYGRGHRVVGGATPCSPCLLRVCPIDFRCMWSVSAGRVVEAAERTLAGCET